MGNHLRPQASCPEQEFCITNKEAGTEQVDFKKPHPCAFTLQFPPNWRDLEVMACYKLESGSTSCRSLELSGSSLVQSPEVRLNTGDTYHLALTRLSDTKSVTGRQFQAFLLTPHLSLRASTIRPQNVSLHSL